MKFPAITREAVIDVFEDLLELGVNTIISAIGVAIVVFVILLPAILFGLGFIALSYYLATGKVCGL